jgi:glucose-6-phosphate isomerase
MSSLRNEGWQKKMEIALNFTNMMESAIGSEHGISEEEIEHIKPRVREIYAQLKEQRKKGALPFLDLPYQDNLVRELKGLSEEQKGLWDNLVILGIGGSALGGIALHRGLNHPFHNTFSSVERGGYPRLFFADNIDPEGFHSLLAMLDLKKTLFNVISKSGETAETMSQFLIVRNLLKKHLGQEEYGRHLIITTDKKKGRLREILQQEHFLSFIIPDGVGGRFSLFTPVGLLPAAMTGIDIEELLAGAALMEKKCQSEELWKNPAYMLALLLYLSDVQKGKSICVFMPYADALKDVADWFRQLWAESLGKRFSLTGEIVETGPTPIKALGVTDQHSQLQLYIEGPHNKVIVFAKVKDYQHEVPIPQDYGDIEGVGYLGGHTLSELIQAERRATERALTNNKRPNLTITLPAVNAFTLGQLFFLLEASTAFAGALYCINPFDQPGVEEGKRFTYGLMGRKGFEDKKQEIEEKRDTKNNYII